MYIIIIGSILEFYVLKIDDIIKDTQIIEHVILSKAAKNFDFVERAGIKHCKNSLMNQLKFFVIDVKAEINQLFFDEFFLDLNLFDNIQKFPQYPANFLFD